jgi:MYXO-CTERM domain-containing protein
MRARRWSVPASAVVCACAALWAGCSSPSSGEVIKTDQAAATSNAGFCRSTTCPAPANFPQNGLCEPPDWPQVCGAAKVRDVPLWWRSGCIGWSLQKDGGKHVAFDEALGALSAGFEAWTSRSCPTSGQGGSRPSIDARYLGPVACGGIGYNKVAPNQNVIVFRDDGWPHPPKTPDDLAPDGTSRTIALTTVTFDSDTGEIFDADMELNTKDHKVIPVTDGTVLDDNTFDLQAVLTHEIGHIFGIAHAPSKASVMYAQDEGHDLRKRTIGLEDIDAICEVYPPDGTRPVDMSVASTGRVGMTACDPTPRHGFTSDCQADPPSGGCSVSSPARGGDGTGGGAGWLVLGAALALRRRRSAR